MYAEFGESSENRLVPYQEAACGEKETLAVQEDEPAEGAQLT
jgi:hypothetical protein